MRDHIYERTHPQQEFSISSPGRRQDPCGGVNLASPIRAASFDEDNHFMVVEVDHRQFSFQTISETNLVVDCGLFERA